MYIKVFVTPDAKREKVEKKGLPTAPDCEPRLGRPGHAAQAGEMLLISVREPALQNRANDRVREIIALRLGTPLGKVRILTGHRARGKMVSVTIKRAREE